MVIFYLVWMFLKLVREKGVISHSSCLDVLKIRMERRGNDLNRKIYTFLKIKKKRVKIQTQWPKRRGPIFNHHAFTPRQQWWFGIRRGPISRRERRPLRTQANPNSPTLGRGFVPSSSSSFFFFAIATF